MKIFLFDLTPFHVWHPYWKFGSLKLARHATWTIDPWFCWFLCRYKWRKKVDQRLREAIIRKIKDFIKWWLPLLRMMASLKSNQNYFPDLETIYILLYVHLIKFFLFLLSIFSRLKRFLPVHKCYLATVRPHSITSCLTWSRLGCTTVSPTLLLGQKGKFRNCPRIRKNLTFHRHLGLKDVFITMRFLRYFFGKTSCLTLNAILVT